MAGVLEPLHALPLKASREPDRSASKRWSPYFNDALRLGLALLVMLLAVWSPYIFGGKTLLASSADVQSIYPTGAGPLDRSVRVMPALDSGAPGWANEPWLALTHRLIFDEHVLPMWNPYGGYGTPFAASMQSQPFNPLTVAVAARPGPWIYNALIVARLFILAFGCALLIRVFTSFTPALIAGICAAFSGYFMLYLDIGHVAVEIMLPWTLLGVELIARRGRASSAVLLAIAWALTLLGGMPESAAIAGVVIGTYAALRIAVTRHDGVVIERLLGVAGGLAVGTMVAGIMLVPFVEYLGRDFDIHQGQSVPGTSNDVYRPEALLTEFAPLALGPPWNNILHGFAGHSGVRGAPGGFALFFGLLATITALVNFARRALVDRVVLIMALIVVALEAKRFGNPLVSWIGALPALRLVQFQKYEEAPIAVLCACLAGFGVAAILERRARMPAIVVAFLVFLATISGLYKSIVIPPATAHSIIFYAAMAFLLAVFTACAATAFWSLRGANPRVVAYVLTSIAFVEGTCAFLVPVYYIVDKPISALRNAYAGAPYIQFLQQATAADGGRIVATAADLFPNWAGAFGLYDTRDLDAMYPQRYLPFISAFLFAGESIENDGYDRFTGMTSFDFDSAPVRRWMELSSITYAVSSRPVLHAQNTFLMDLWSQAEPTIEPPFRSAVRLASVVVNGTAELSLFEHPPYRDLRYESVIARKAPWLAVDITLDPSIWATNCGGAVIFRLDALNPAGVVVATATRSIDPKHHIADRRFTRLTLDLRRQIARHVTLRFGTSVPPPGDTCAAWAHWGEPRWTATKDLLAFREPATPSFERVAAVHDAYVYHVSGALPRLALFHSVVAASNGDVALRTLVSPAFDVKRTLIVEGTAPSLSGNSQSDRVDVLRRSSQRVEADVTTAGNALLLQNDTWYPGWKATVDGRDAPILVADYLFRAVAIPAGHHHVVIAYQSRAVLAGLTLSLLGIVLVLGCVLTAAAMRYTRRRAAHPQTEVPA